MYKHVVEVSSKVLEDEVSDFDFEVLILTLVQQKPKCEDLLKTLATQDDIFSTHLYPME